MQVRSTERLVLGPAHRFPAQPRVIGRLLYLRARGYHWLWYVLMYTIQERSATAVDESH